MTENTTYTANLLTGYTDKKGVVHKRVVFGKRLKGKEYFAIHSDPQSKIATQHGDLIARASIVKFGELSMPVPLNVLLSLDLVDREIIAEALEQFLQNSLEDRTIEYRDNETVRLAFGYDSNGLVYDLVTFGQMTNGYDEVEADRLGLEGAQRVCFLMGKQITKLSQSEGTSEFEGPISLNIFESLDALDIQALRVGAERWKQFFRRRAGEVLQGERSGENGLPSDASERPA